MSDLEKLLEKYNECVSILTLTIEFDMPSATKAIKFELDELRLEIKKELGLCD